MNNFLGLMAASSRARVGDLRAREPLVQLRTRALDTPVPPRLRRQDRFDLIAELKCRSPSAGCLGLDDIATRVTAYANGGAAAVSVLTEPTQFGGEISHLQVAAGALREIGVPVMRKDFIIDPYQLFETRAASGGGILLILCMLSEYQLSELIDCARELGLFVLLELFDEEDLERAVRALAREKARASSLSIMLGVNCRDLQTLAVRPQRLTELAPRLPNGTVKVAESGIESAFDCAQLVRAGFDMALVGTALMKCRDPAPLIGCMLAAGRAA